MGGWKELSRDTKTVKVDPCLPESFTLISTLLDDGWEIVEIKNSDCEIGDKPSAWPDRSLFYVLQKK